MISQTFHQQLNNAYAQLEWKQMEIKDAVALLPNTIKTGWYNGHYQKNAEGDWVRNAYPIPEVDVINLCDIEIGFDSITVTTKLKREAALSCSFEELKHHSFEAYGVQDYLSDYYHPGQIVEDLKDNVRKSDETEIGFSFTFPFETEGKYFFEFAELLRREGFYY